MANIRPTSTVFTRFLKLTLGTWLIRRYRLSVEHREVIESLEPPYLLLPNHVSFWDPFFVGYLSPYPVYWVTSDRQFRNRLLKSLLGLVGAIPKSKGIADLETIRKIFDVKRHGGVIGIFPEGRRNWDGHTLPLIYPTAKLVKSLKIPVVVPILKGAFLTLPRWSRVRRKGAVTVEYRSGPGAEELASMSVDEVFERLSALVDHDEWRFQRERMIPLKGRRRADGLERSIFLCQSCEEIGTLASDGNRLNCRQCGKSVEVTEYGFFDGSSRFETIREWNLWQLECLRSRLSSCAEAVSPQDTTAEPCLSDGPATVHTGYRSKEMKRLTRGRCALYPDRLQIDGTDGDRYDFPLARVSGVNVQNKEQLEFYYGDSLYNFVFDQSVSGYKWMIAIRMLQGAAEDTVDLSSI